MSSPYNPYAAMADYKRRKLSRIGDTVKLPNVRENIGRVQTTSTGVMRRRGVPSSLLIDQQKDNEMAASTAFRETAAPIYLAKQKEKDLLRDELKGLNIKSDMFEDEQKRIRDEKKKSKDKMFTKLGFTIAGGIAGTAMGNPLLGIKLGSSAGDMAAGSGVGTGDFMGEDTIDEGLIAEGLRNTVMTVSNEIQLSKPKALNDMIGENVDNIVGMGREARTEFNETLKMFLSTGNYKAAMDLINSTFANTEGNQQYQPPVDGLN